MAIVYKIASIFICIGFSIATPNNTVRGLLKSSNISPNDIYANIDDGSCEYLNIRETLLPLSYNLNPAYPNPFNPAAIISFSIPDFGFTTITAYDIRGRQLAILTSQFLEPGYYSAKWNASQYPSGIYFIQMVSGQYIKTRKVMLVK